MCVYVCVCIYTWHVYIHNICIYIHIYTHIYVYIYMKKFISNMLCKIFFFFLISETVRLKSNGIDHLENLEFLTKLILRASK